MNGQYDSESNIGPVWGICFLLYRRGRLDEFYKVMPDEQLRKLFQQDDASINNKKPIKIPNV